MTAILMVTLIRLHQSEEITVYHRILKRKQWEKDYVFFVLIRVIKDKSVPTMVIPKGVCNQESNKISIEHQIQMVKIFTKGRMSMLISKELYLKTMLAGTSQIKWTKKDLNQDRMLKYKEMVDDQMYIMFHQEWE